jgi:hypothetical protein
MVNIPGTHRSALAVALLTAATVLFLFPHPHADAQSAQKATLTVYTSL